MSQLIESPEIENLNYKYSFEGFDFVRQNGELLLIHDNELDELEASLLEAYGEENEDNDNFLEKD